VAYLVVGKVNEGDGEAGGGDRQAQESNEQTVVRLVSRDRKDDVEEG